MQNQLTKIEQSNEFLTRHNLESYNLAYRLNSQNMLMHGVLDGLGFISHIAVLGGNSTLTYPRKLKFGMQAPQKFLFKLCKPQADPSLAQDG